jgi:hypothetical protein
MNAPSTKLQRKPTRSAERARTHASQECGGTAAGVRQKGGGSQQKVWSDII